MLTLLSPALTVALLGAIESLMSAVVADRMSGDRHNPNVELVAQGVANVVSPMFGGLPATGAIARTATNIRSGARTPVAGMIHALTLLGVLLVGAPLAGHVPMAGARGDPLRRRRQHGRVARDPGAAPADEDGRGVWVVTFALTVFADLTVAVEVGMILAALLYIRRVSNTTTVCARDGAVRRRRAGARSAGQAHSGLRDDLPRSTVRFCSAPRTSCRRSMDRVDELPPVVVFRLRNMTAIDATGLRALEDAASALRQAGRTAVFCGARSATAGRDGAGGVPRCGRSRQCLRQHQRCAEAGGRDLEGQFRVRRLSVIAWPSASRMRSASGASRPSVSASVIRNGSEIVATTKYSPAGRPLTE